MNEFGKQLRVFRQDCRGIDGRSHVLTQEQIGGLLGIELGTKGFSGAAVSDWERGVSKIHADDRGVLVSLLKVLHQQGGLHALSEANKLLEMGNYRDLNSMEAQRIFTGNGLGAPSANIMAGDYLLEQLLGRWSNEFQTLIGTAQKGPTPTWSRVLAALWRKMTDHWSAVRLVRAMFWVWIWLLTWWWISPVLRLPFIDEEQASRAIRLSLAAFIATPLLVGLATNTKDDSFWIEQGLGKATATRLYVYQGAGIGFNLGYFFVFGISLFRYYLHLQPSIWYELIAAAVPVIVAAMAARLVPHNLLLAYKRLSVADGWIFFVVALLGPFWAFFLMQVYSILLIPATGALTILIAITLIVFIEAHKVQRK